MNLPPNPISALAILYEKHPALKVLVALVPGAGAAHELLQARGQELIAERTRVFFEALGAGNIALTDELTASNEFLHCFVKTMKAAQQTRRAEKIELLGNLLRGAINSSDLDFDQYEEFLDVLDQMSLREVEALQMMYRREQASQTSVWERESIQIRSYWEELKSEMTEKLGIEQEEIDPFIARLVRTGFYKENKDSFHGDVPKFGMTTRQFEKVMRVLTQTSPSPSVIV